MKTVKEQAGKNGISKGIRTPVPTVKGWCPRPLDDGDTKKQHKPEDGISKGIRTPVPTVKGWCPRPLDDGDTSVYCFLVEVSGIEPLTSCMPCKRSPS